MTTIQPDWAAIITAMAALIAAVTGLMSVILGRQNAQQAKQTHDLVNSTAATLTAAATGQARAEGILVGEQSQRDRMAPPTTNGGAI